ncbi:hypothetical protein AVEN_155282-1 [Araneus ventricosus]|uniref:Mos1 transposase HTH domain-containing protein n=1 Tax=Araneus ventricosus TaxID=182803 RepID=A0A4Y2D6D1_ARAVE|nr:hypothetical protein AVEN_155282-1 [Araneus ventricosus]
MNGLLERWFKLEVSAVIRFFNAKNVSAAEIQRQLVEFDGLSMIRLHSETKWHTEFQTGTKRSKNVRQQNMRSAGNPGSKRIITQVLLYLSGIVRIF